MGTAAEVGLTPMLLSTAVEMLLAQWVYTLFPTKTIFLMLFNKIENAHLSKFVDFGNMQAGLVGMGTYTVRAMEQTLLL